NLPDSSDSDKVQVSKVIDVNKTSGEVIVAGQNLQMGDRLFVEVNGIMAAMEVTYPMMTTSRCKMIGQAKAFVFRVDKGMPVFRLMSGIKRGSNTFLFPNGNKYIGEFRGSKMHGKGEFYWTNGNVYNGDFRKGKRHGKGTITYYYNCTYNGDFSNGKMEGQ